MDGFGSRGRRARILAVDLAVDSSRAPHAMIRPLCRPSGGPMSKTPAPLARFPRIAIATVLAASLAAASVADAKTLRWAGRGDPQTMDPYSQNENLTNNIN